MRKICGENNKKDRKRLFCIFQIGIWEASFEVFVSIILLVGFFGRSFMIQLGFPQVLIFSFNGILVSILLIVAEKIKQKHGGFLYEAVE